jgi:hypothetical protein
LVAVCSGYTRFLLRLRCYPRLVHFGFGSLFGLVGYQFTVDSRFWFTLRSFG